MLKDVNVCEYMFVRKVFSTPEHGLTLGKYGWYEVSSTKLVEAITKLGQEGWEIAGTGSDTAGGIKEYVLVRYR